jgi:hypothetical protein
VCCVPDKQQCQLQTWNLLENLSYWRALSNGLVLHRECKLTSQQRLRKGGGRLLEYLPLLDNLNARTSLQAPLYCYKRCLFTHFELLLILDGDYSHNDIYPINDNISKIICARLYSHYYPGRFDIYIYIALIMSVVRFECTEIKVESYSKTRINKILIGVSRSLQIYP